MKREMTVGEFLVMAAVAVGFASVCELAACGTPLAPKDVCVQWARVTPDGGLSAVDAAPEQ